jgi:tetratricopeptide (TPR) repeat protein
MGKGKILKVTSDSDEAKNAFDMGRWQLYNLEWENAHKSFSNAIEQDANFAIAYAMRARTSGFLGNQGDIADDLDIAVSMSLNASKDEAAMINAVASDMKNGTSTFNVLSESLSDKYSDDSFLAFETVFATISDRGADVVLDRAKALYAMNPNFTPVLNMMGYAYMDKGDLDNAGKKFQEQIRRAAGSANPYDSMGDYYLAINDKTAALKYFEQSAKMGLKASVSKADSLRSEFSKQDN